MAFYMFKRLVESALMIASTVLSDDWNSHRHPQCKFTPTTSARPDSGESVVAPRRLATMMFYMPGRLAESALLIASTVLSNEWNSHRHPQWQLTPTASPPLDFQRSVVGPQGLDKLVSYMSKKLAASASLIGSTVLSNDWNSHRQFASTPSPTFDSRGSVVGPQGLTKMVSYMFERLAESALLIAATVLSNDWNLHRHPQWQFAPTASPPLDFQRSIIGPPALAKRKVYMSERRAESGLLIASTVLSNDWNSQCQFAPTAYHRSSFNEAS
jgi:hypothetical protein